VSARLIVEAANMPLTAAADGPLTRRGALILPDVVANSATNAWWWWTVFGDIGPGAEEAFAKISGSMRKLVTATLDRAELGNVTPRAAAAVLAAEASTRIARRFDTA
jgi:glutamate dehydrogenase (NAD(P)+)